MAKGTQQNPTAFIGKCDKMEAGVTKNLPGKASLNVGGSGMSAAQINGKLGTADTLYQDVVNAKSAWKQALAAYKAALPGLRTFMAQLVLALKNQFGDGNPILEEFGIAPRKPAKKSVETKAKAVAASRLTRQERGPTGSLQRSKVTTSGSPGLALVNAQGQVVPGALAGPIPPGSAAPAEVPAVSLTGGGTPAAGSGSGSSGSK